MEPGAVTNLKAMLIGMNPKLNERSWCFHAISDPAFIPDTAFAVIREDEGMSCIIPAPAAADDAPQFARITLQVHSDLSGVGLTAAVSTRLAAAGIACNVIAGLRHDHLFVPWEKREDAMALLIRLSLDAR